MSETFLDVVRSHALYNAALAWWNSKRPVSFTDADHLADPTINCVGVQERVLARAVVDIVKAKEHTDD